jgi:alanyl-tRNA synthetase
LHAALRNHLGTGVRQAGSLVEASRLRFDFTHNGPVPDAKLVDIESEVNEAIRHNFEVSDQEMPYDDAIRAGALAFFGEKYGDVVRVVRMGDYSVELCGGTHVRRTGDIGLYRFVGESGVASGVRRVEAVTGSGALERVRDREGLLRDIGKLLRGSEEEAVAKLERLLAGARELERRIADLERQQSGDRVAELIAQARPVEGGRVIVARVDGIESKAMREMSDQMRDRLESGVVVLVAAGPSGVALTVAVTKDLLERYRAGDLVRELAPIIGGRGGGKPDFAQAGGKDAEKIPLLLEKANELIR